MLRLSSMLRWSPFIFYLVLILLLAGPGAETEAEAETETETPAEAEAGIEADSDRPSAAPGRLSVATHQSYDPDRWTVVGSRREYQVRGRESLLEIARDHGLGYREISRVNPDLDPFLPGAGAKVLLPTIRILPATPFDQGILLNLAEKRLYYFHTRNHEPLVISFPVGIGTSATDTPRGDYTITGKLIEPSWTVPASLRARRPYLPAVVPPGPDNPMGSHALQLSHGSYFIHGTNRPWSIGRRATLGCIRLYPEDIPVLFSMVPPGTPVRIIDQAIKVGRQGDQIYLEVHHRHGDDGESWRACRDEALELLRRPEGLHRIDRDQVADACRRGEGIAVVVGRTINR